MKSRICLVITVVAAFLGVAATPSFAAVTCGSLITHSITLHKNLHCTSGDGLDVTASNVTVNLNGFTISTTSTHFNNGIYVNHASGVKVINGTIKHFNDGVRVDSVGGGTVAKLHLVDNLHNIRVLNSGAVTVRSNTTNGGDAGILTSGGNHGLTIVGNTLHPGGGSGVRLNGTTNSYVAHNTIVDGLDRGIYLLASANNNDIFANVITDPTNVGIQIDDSQNNVIDSNTVKKASTGIQINSTNPGDSAGNQLLNNSVTTSDADGIQTAGNAASTLVDSNTTNANGVNGIEVNGTDAGTHVSNNTANNNVVYGLFLGSLSIDAGGNHASGNNGGGQQCVNATC